MLSTMSCQRAAMNMLTDKSKQRVQKRNLNTIEGEMTILNEYSAYGNKFIQMKTQVESILDSQHGTIHTFQNWIDLDKTQSTLVHSAGY